MAEKCQAQNGTGWDSQWATAPLPLYPRLYRVSFPIAARSVVFPVEGCNGWAMTNTKIRIHSMHRPVQDTIVIIEEGNQSHPHWHVCDMFVPWAVLKRRHPTTALCVRRIEKAENLGGGGMGGCSNIVPGIWQDTAYSEVIKMHGDPSNCDVQLLAGSLCQPPEIT